MPISSLQSRVLGVLAGHRNPDSFIAGSIPINRVGPRLSRDIDIFHDRTDIIAGTAHADAAALVGAGLNVSWLRELPALFSARISDGTSQTTLDWLADSDFRFFPAIADEEFGYVLHMADLAMNKLLAAASRRELRDLVDLLTLHERFLPLGAIALAAVEAAPGFTPEGLLAEIRRNLRYPAHAFEELDVASPLDPADVMRRLRMAIEAAEQFVTAMPSDKVGCLFLRDGRPVQPEAGELGGLTEHRGTRRGHWPGSPELTNAMLERYRRAGLIG